MIAVTLQQAKATLNNLVEKARSGEDVVLMRGSKVVATIVPLDNSDLNIVSRLTDPQAARFWAQIQDEKTTTFSSPDKAIKHIKSKTK